MFKTHPCGGIGWKGRQPGIPYMVMLTNKDLIRPWSNRADNIVSGSAVPMLSNFMIPTDTVEKADSIQYINPGKQGIILKDRTHNINPEVKITPEIEYFWSLFEEEGIYCITVIDNKDLWWLVSPINIGVVSLFRALSYSSAIGPAHRAWSFDVKIQGVQLDWHMPVRSIHSDQKFLKMFIAGEVTSQKTRPFVTNVHKVPYNELPLYMENTSPAFESLLKVGSYA